MHDIMHKQNAEQLHAHDHHQNVTEIQATEYNTKKYQHMHQTGTVSQAIIQWSSLAGISHTVYVDVLCRTHRTLCILHQGGMEHFHCVFRQALAPIGDFTHELWIKLAGKSHTAYMDAAHWTSAPCTLQNVYTKVAWTDEALSPSFWHVLALITVAIHGD